MSSEYLLVIGGIAQVLAAVFSIVVVLQSRRESVRPIIEITNFQKKPPSLNDNRLKFDLQMKNVGFDVGRNFEVWYSTKSELTQEKPINSDVKKIGKEEYCRLETHDSSQLFTSQILQDRVTSTRFFVTYVDEFKILLVVKCCTRNNDFLTTCFHLSYKNEKTTHKLVYRKWDKKLIFV